MSLVVLVGAIASLFSGLRIIETRRRLQANRRTPVSLTEAIIHTAFDTVDKVSNEWNKISFIIDQRMNQQPAMLTFVDQVNKTRPQLMPPSSPLALPSSQPMFQAATIKPLPRHTDNMTIHKTSDPMLASIPDHSLHHH